MDFDNPQIRKFVNLSGCRLFLVDCPNLPLAIVAAVRADAMRRLRLVALRAEVRGSRGQRIVRATLRGAGLGVSAFWIRHVLRNRGSFSRSSSQKLTPVAFPTYL